MPRSLELPALSIPQGPVDLAEMFAWPLQLKDDFRRAEQGSPGSWGRLLEWMNSGVLLFTQYSGQGSPEQAAAFIERALMHQHFLSSSAHGIRCVEACDLSSHCRSALMAFSESHGPKHVFGDMHLRLPRHVYLAIKDFIPAESDYKMPGPAIEAAHAQVKRILLESTQDMFLPGHVAECFRHGGPCPLFHVSDMKHTRLRMFVAGVTCKDSSRSGLRRHHLGPHFPTLMVWVAERRARREDVGLLECTVGFDSQLIIDLLGDLYETCVFNFGPKDIGWWCDRPRLFMMFFLRSSVVFLSTIEIFKSIFTAARPTDGATAQQPALLMGRQMLAL